MGKRKVKPFIDKKRSTTYTILPKTQAELALLGEDQEETTDDHRPRHHHDDVSTSSSSFQQWKNQLQRAGIVLSDDQLAHRYLKEVTGDGVFVDAASGRTTQLVVDPTTTTTTTPSRRVTTASTEWTQDPVDPNSELLFDNVDLTLDCMDDDMRKILMLGELGDEALFDSELLVVEELDDDFCLQAAQEPEPSSTAAFDYDAHIRQLLDRARKERDNEFEVIGDRHPAHPGMVDRDFFAGKSKSKSSKVRAGSSDDFDDSDDDGEYDANDLDDWILNQSTEQAAIGSVGAGTGGVSSKLRPDEEKALCDKFLETLAEYDNNNDSASDDDDFDEGSGNGGERHGTVDDDDDECDEEDHDEDDGESALEDEHTGGGGMLGEAELEAAMDDFLRENQEDILVQGRHPKNGDANGPRNETGGSGYSVLVGTRMVPASTWTGGADKGDPDAPSDDAPPESVADILAEADAALAAPIEILTLDSVITVEEFDGKSYFSERTKNPWDCESILSTYSNLDNNPAVIDHTASTRNRRRRKNRITAHQEAVTAAPKIMLSSKTGLPIRAPQHNAAEEDESRGASSTIGVNRGAARNKNESKEEKRARKMAAKQERQVSQARKKELRNAFGHELQKRAAVATTDAPVGSAVFRYS